MCPFSILAFLQPTTVDKEPYQKGENQFGPLQVITFHQPNTVDNEPELRIQFLIY